MEIQFVFIIDIHRIRVQFGGRDCVLFLELAPLFGSKQGLDNSTACPCLVRRINAHSSSFTNAGFENSYSILCSKEFSVKFEGVKGCVWFDASERLVNRLRFEIV